ncbi:MAG: hypothetical protein JST18_00435 [Bacteroidetes bacterium]|nr:hypothetical protein [Bacteroidota bacterium]
MDESFLKVMHAMAKEYMAYNDVPLHLSEKQLSDLKRRIARHKKGESKSYNWSEVKSHARNRTGK